MTRNRIIITLTAAAAVSLLTFSCTNKKKAAAECATVEATYSNDILPIIRDNCYKCHGVGSSHGDFTTYNGLSVVLENGDFEKEVLKKKEMPPKGPLPDDQLKKIRCWVFNGAKNN